MIFSDEVDFIKLYLDNSNERGKINLKTQELYRKDIEDFDGFLVNKTLLEVEEKDIINYIENLKNRYSTSSIYRKITTLRSFYKFLLQKKIIENNPSKKILVQKQKETKIEKLEKWELNNILEVCNLDNLEELRDWLIIKLIYETGLKINEILRLKKENIINFKRINCLQNGNIFQIELSEKASEKLKNYMENMYMDNNNIFEGISVQNFRSRFINYGIRAKIDKRITPSMINKIKKEVNSEDKETYFAKIREEYMRIGIGDE